MTTIVHNPELADDPSTADGYLLRRIELTIDLVRGLAADVVKQIDDHKSQQWLPELIGDSVRVLEAALSMGVSSTAAAADVTA